MIAVFKKELSVYFHSVIGFLFIGALLFLLGLYTTIYNLFSGYSSLAYPLQGVTFLLIILVSVLILQWIWSTSGKQIKRVPGPLKRSM